MPAIIGLAPLDPGTQRLIGRQGFARSLVADNNTVHTAMSDDVIGPPADKNGRPDTYSGPNYHDWEDEGDEDVCDNERKAEFCDAWRDLQESEDWIGF